MSRNSKYWDYRRVKIPEHDFHIVTKESSIGGDNENEVLNRASKDAKLVFKAI